jgi:hypothetical protein
MSNPDKLIEFNDDEVNILSEVIDSILDNIDDDNNLEILESIKGKLDDLQGISKGNNDGNEIHCMEEYNDKIFWKELLERLSTKEMIKIYGKEKIEVMSDGEFQLKYIKIEERIREEIEKNGLGNIIINNMI